MESDELVIYRETKPDLGFMREIVVEQAMSLLQIRLDILRKDNPGQVFLSFIKEFISGFDDSCSSAALGVVYKVPDGYDDNEVADWCFKNLFDRELYLFSTWDQNYRGETMLSGFEQDFRLHKRMPA